MPTIAERVAGIVAPPLEDLGLSLYDVEYAGGALRVLVSGPAGSGPGIDELAGLTRTISRLLDDADPIQGHYTLEVSSPGIERVLRTPAHFAGAIGSDVAVKTVPGTDGERRVTGTLVAAGEDTVTVRQADGTERAIALADIEKARTTFAWGPGPKPGAPKNPKKKAVS